MLDSSTPPNPVSGVPILFTTVLRLPEDEGGGPEPIGQNPQRVIVGSLQSAVTSDSDGYAAIIPSKGDSTRPLEVDVSADPGNGAALQFQFDIFPVPCGLSESRERLGL